ncbi:MAG: KpsF/GutQ family sugar-phosphate isomerase [Saprospiraceae bacterium]|nr:KpsF/GutQ family sugar-phosphate isomerase [Saprospiraceae bacterium]
MNSSNQILAVATRTLAIELETVQALQSALNQDFVDTVLHLQKSKGRIVVTGIGKSAIIGQKWVATFNSTGSPALFMHGADAIHGDLGMLQPDDSLIILSKSGETPEIKVLVPLVKQFGNKLIAVVAQPDSYLAKQADLVIHTPVSREAEPNNLAPTSSTTAQLVIGDALATCLLALRKFTPEHFARFHPGGTLGKQLYLRVRDLMIRHEKPEVRPQASLQEVIMEMTSKRVGATAVTDESGSLLGIITDGDLRRMLSKSQDLTSWQAEAIMTPEPKTISGDELAVDALALMRRMSITQLIVLAAERYVGIIHLHDILQEGLL